MNSSNINTTISYEQNHFFKILKAISNSTVYKKYTPELGKQHKLEHIQKVLLFSQIIAQNENIDENQTKILLVSAAFHDCGRIKDRDNGVHGLESAEIAGEYFRKNVKNPYGIANNEIGMIQSTIEYHVVEEHIPGQINEIILKEICNKYRVSVGEYEKVKQISAILKDADALDRTRFVSGSDLNHNFLRTSTAKKIEMIEFAKKINNEFARQVINTNYPSFQNISADKVKLLHCIRQKLKKENKIDLNRERNIPINTIISIFSEDNVYKIEDFER